MERSIRHIGVGSAFKVGLVLFALLWLVIAFFVVLVPGLLGASLMDDLLSEIGIPFSGFGVGVALVIYLLGTVFYAILGGISLAIQAAIYNVVAAITGGIVVRFDERGGE